MDRTCGALAGVPRYVTAGVVATWPGSAFPHGTMAVKVTGAPATGFIATMTRRCVDIAQIV
ncbi:MAG: hypothetical protein ACREQB_02565 [Candidatus Binataceae bacterium]